MRGWMERRRRVVAWSLVVAAVLLAVALVGWGVVELARGVLRNAILVDTLPTENTVQTPELEAADRTMLGGAGLAGAGLVVLGAAVLGMVRLDALNERRPAELDDPFLLATLAELRALVVGFSAI